MANDILLDAQDDLLIDNGDFVIGNSLTQEIGIIIRLNQGELKSDPVLGPNLIKLINSNATKNKIRDRVKLHLERDDKNYNDIKDYININQD